MKPYFRNKNRKARAQAMVEFMLALPILLMILYGLIEVGRLAFVFSAVANASRQAARYGSASGEVNDLAFYQDCDGIREVVNESGFIIEFEEINITYDRGVDEDGNQIPISGVDPDPNQDTCPIDPGVIRNGDRIIVQVSAVYEPIISIIPDRPLRVVSSSARSFLISVPIVGSALPTSFSPETSTPSPEPGSGTITPTVALSPTFTHIPPRPTFTLPPNVTPTDTLPPTLTFTPSLTFTPTLTLPPTITPSVTPTAISCSGLTGVSHGKLTIWESYMEMSITNLTGHTLSVANVYVEWNHDTGHGEGNDPGLRLQRIFLAADHWDGDIYAPSAYIEAFYPHIPPGDSIVRFTFHQDYKIADGTERIIISISTPGCVNYPLDSRN